MDNRPQPPPPPDAPNAGDPTPGTLHLGDFIIEGVDRVSEEQELSDHAIVFYNELIKYPDERRRSFVATHLEGEV